MSTKSDELEVGYVSSHFLDSGAYTLWTKSKTYAKENRVDRWAYYHTVEFWQFMDEYAAFVKKYKIGIDLYANMDVIDNPDLSWRNQQYLEQAHGLHPVPVVHCHAPLRWVHHYLNHGYDILGFGGDIDKGRKQERKWADAAFDMVCSQPSRLPKIKIHGFGVTSFRMLRRYPWWSVDSSSWAKIGAYGGILIPHCRGDQFIFDQAPYVLKVSQESPDRFTKGKHFDILNRQERVIVRKWLEQIGVALGKVDADGEVVEEGVRNSLSLRKVANLLFFEEMRKTLPDWPWPFQAQRRKTLWG